MSLEPGDGEEEKEERLSERTWVESERDRADLRDHCTDLLYSGLEENTWVTQ